MNSSQTSFLWQFGLAGIFITHDLEQLFVAVYPYLFVSIVQLSICSLRSASFKVEPCSRLVCSTSAGGWGGRLRASIAKYGSSVRFLQGLFNLFNLGLDSGFSLLLVGQVPEDELEALEKVKREEEAQARVLRRRVRNVEEEHIETERIHCRQRLQFLEL